MGLGKTLTTPPPWEVRLRGDGGVLAASAFLVGTNLVLAVARAFGDGAFRRGDSRVAAFPGLDG
ncbi:hypothetical protein, partial [Streptomyces phytophilus]|uniref:hypothetical protein n=1 Tax=Streptomyces phytophilus TaxID=722715 RepID=UPI0015F02C33